VRSDLGDAVTALSFALGVVAAGYLLYAMLRPERF
jgi:K+-transporting ATPase KdpF subunit